MSEKEEIAKIMGIGSEPALEKPKRRVGRPRKEKTEEKKEGKTTITLNGRERIVTGEASKKDVDELAQRLTETDSIMAIVSQRQETGMANLNTRINEHDDKLADLERRLSDEFDRLVNVEKGVKEIHHNIRDDLNGIYRNLKDMEQVVTGQKTETDRRLDSLTDMTEQVEILRDKVRSQEAVIAELETKVAKMESDVGETFEEAGRMIRDVKDESTQKVEEIAREMETRLMERAQEDTEAKLKEATRIQNKDITVMKQRMENVFSRMKRVEEDPSIKAMRHQLEYMQRDMKSIMWVAAGALVSALALGIVTILGFAGGF